MRNVRRTLNISTRIKSTGWVPNTLLACMISKARTSSKSRGKFSSHFPSNYVPVLHLSYIGVILTWMGYLTLSPPSASINIGVILMAVVPSSKVPPSSHRLGDKRSTIFLLIPLSKNTSNTHHLELSTQGPWLLFWAQVRLP